MAQLPLEQLEHRVLLSSDPVVRAPLGQLAVIAERNPAIVDDYRTAFEGRDLENSTAAALRGTTVELPDYWSDFDDIRAIIAALPVDEPGVSPDPTFVPVDGDLLPAEEVFRSEVFGRIPAIESFATESILTFGELDRAVFTSVLAGETDPSALFSQ